MDYTFEVTVNNAPSNLSPTEIIMAIQNLLSEKGAFAQVTQR